MINQRYLNLYMHKEYLKLGKSLKKNLAKGLTPENAYLYARNMTTLYEYNQSENMLKKLMKLNNIPQYLKVAGNSLMSVNMAFKGRFKTANDYLIKAAELINNPTDSIFCLLDKAILATFTGEIKKANKFITEAIQSLNPSHYFYDILYHELNYQLGNNYYVSGELEKANKLLNELINKYPESINALLLLALLKIAMGDYGKELELYKRISSITKNELIIDYPIYRSAENYYNKGEYNIAMSLYEKVANFKRSPLKESAQKLCQKLKGLKYENDDEIKVTLDISSSIAKKPDECVYKSIELLLEYYDIEEDISDLKPEQNIGVPIYQLVRVLEEKGFYTVQFYADFEVVKKMISNGFPILSDEYTENEGHIVLIIGYDAIIETIQIKDTMFVEPDVITFEEYLKIKEKNNGWMMVACPIKYKDKLAKIINEDIMLQDEIFCKQNDFELANYKPEVAINVLKKLIEYYPSHMPFFRLLIENYLQNNENKKALDCLMMLPKQAKETSWAAKLRNDVYLKLDQCQEALNDIKENIKKDNESIYDYLTKAVLEIRNNNFAVALSDIKKAEFLGPDIVDVYMIYMYYYSMTGNSSMENLYAEIVEEITNSNVSDLQI